MMAYYELYLNYTDPDPSGEGDNLLGVGLGINLLEISECNEQFLRLLSNEGLIVMFEHEYEECEWVMNILYMND